MQSKFDSKTNAVPFQIGGCMKKAAGSYSINVQTFSAVKDAFFLMNVGGVYAAPSSRVKSPASGP